LFCRFQFVPAVASEEGTENSDDGVGAAAPTPAFSHTHTHTRKRKYGKTVLSEDECLSQALNFVRRVLDDFERFGESLGMELRSLSSDT
jgi:hypothetical protein